jgi:hypothetical protein
VSTRGEAGVTDIANPTGEVKTSDQDVVDPMNM